MAPKENLQAAIARAIDAKALPRLWTSAELVARRDSHFPTYSERTLTSVPSTRYLDAATGATGHGVKDPATAPFIRVTLADGTRRYCLREHFDGSLATPAAPAPTLRLRGVRRLPHGPRATIEVTQRLSAPIAPPADYATFRERAADLLGAAERVIMHEALGATRGWRDWLAAYRWGAKEPGWERGVAERMTNRDAVRAMRDDRSKSAAAYERVVNDWGGIKQKLGPEWDGPIHATMDALEAAPDAPNQVGATGRRIASVSKLYAALAPEAWVIYDSRVAAALAYLAHAGGVAEGYRAWIVVMKGKGSAQRLVKGFPRDKASPPGAFTQPEAFRSFVLASWFCRAMAERLNAAQTPLPDGRVGGWTAYHVEMVLFMLGADLRKLPVVKVAPGAGCPLTPTPVPRARPMSSTMSERPGV